VKLTGRDAEPVATQQIGARGTVEVDLAWFVSVAGWSTDARLTVWSLVPVRHRPG
jgi:hypothetical protein